jgi:ATP-binding cassette, subfamily B, multidrug efflux pump
MSFRIAKFQRIAGYLRTYRRLILKGILCLVVTDILALVPPWLVKDAIDALPTLKSARPLLPYIGLLVGVVAVQAAFRFFWRNALFGVARRVEYHLRNDLFRHLQRMDRRFFLRHPVGDLMSRCTNDLVAIQEVIAFVGLLIVDSSLTICTCLILMTVIDLPLTLASLVPLPLLSLCFLVFGRKVKARAGEVQVQLAALTQTVQETLAGIRVVQAYTMERTREEAYRGVTENYIRKNVELAKIRGLFFSSLGLLTGVAAVIVLWMGGTRVVSGQLTLGGFVAFNTYLVMLSWPMMSVGFMVNLFQRARASHDRLEQVFGQIPDIADPPTPRPLPRVPDELRFETVGFRYPGTERFALREISIVVPPGARVGITGPVGCGKSTLLDLVPRIHDPTEGTITLHGDDLRSYSLREWRQRVAWVAQEPFLFSDPIAANVAFGAPHSPMAEVDRAARLARLDKDLDAFPQGWETVVGERGITLSGGQRQRLALARAAMTSPGILVLDDAFAHLDTETESEILSNILAALPSTTILFVSHRISTLRKASWVVVLSQGRIIEQGTPADLLQRGGYFQRTFQQQEILQEMERWGGGPRP